MLDSKTYRSTMSKIGLSYFFLLLIYLVASVFLSIIFIIIAPNALESDWYMWVVNFISLYVIAAPIFVIIINANIKFKVPSPPKKHVKLSQLLIYIVISAGSAYIFNVVTIAIETLITSITGLQHTNSLDFMLEGQSLLWIFFSTCIAAPIGEEILFRKILYNKMAHLGDKCYIITSGVLFGVFHGNLSQLIYACALGMIFAYLYVYTGDILIPIGIHFVVNTIGTVLLPIVGEETMLMTVIGLVILAVMICAPIIIVKSIKAKKIVLRKPYRILPKRAFLKGTLNVGMIIYLFMGVLLIALNFIPAE